MRPCPGCSAAFTLADLLMADGAAVCPQCDKVTPLREIAEPFQTPADDSAATLVPPIGCRSLDTLDGFRISCKRGLIDMLPILGFALIWNGMLSIFQVTLCSALYHHLFGPPPAWLPLPPHPIVNGAPIGVLGTIGLAVFVVLFTAIGLLILFGAVTGLAGRTLVQRRHNSLTVRSSVGPFGRRWSFDVGALVAVGVRREGVGSTETITVAMTLQDDRTIEFGGLLRDDQHDWLAAELRRRLRIAPATRGGA